MEKELENKIRQQLPFVRKLEEPLRPVNLIRCRDCGELAKRVALSGSYTRVYGIYQCVGGHFFTRG